MDPTQQIDPDDSTGNGDLPPHVDTGGPVPEGMRELRLRDGSRVWVRPIREEDRERIVTGLSWMSERSRYLRFHSAVSELTPRQLDYLVDVDHEDHEALVAVDPDRDGMPGVAVARYIRLKEDPTVAEAAITVIDAYQGRGIGTAMIGMLEPIAHEQGIRTFRNYVLAENEAMLEIFRQLDGELVEEGSGMYRVDVPVPGEGDRQPDTPAGRWVASVGRNTHSRMDSWAYPLIWLVRKVAGSEEEPSAGPSRLLKSWASRDGEEEDPPRLED